MDVLLRVNFLFCICTQHNSGIQYTVDIHMDLTIGSVFFSVFFRINGELLILIFFINSQLNEGTLYSEDFHTQQN